MKHERIISEFGRKIAMMKKKYQVVCATHEASGDRPHRFFTWAEDSIEALFHDCPTCGSEGLTSVVCHPYTEDYVSIEEWLKNSQSQNLGEN